MILDHRATIQTKIHIEGNHTKWIEDQKITIEGTHIRIEPHSNMAMIGVSPTTEDSKKTLITSRERETLKVIIRDTQTMLLKEVSLLEDTKMEARVNFSNRIRHIKEVAQIMANQTKNQFQ